MKSISERSFGSRIGNAESLVATVQNFTDYQPLKPAFSMSSFSGLITTTKGLNNTVTEKKKDYSIAVDNRIRIFEKGDASIKKVLSPINATVKVCYGITSKEARDVATIIAKIRGANIKHSNSTQAQEATVSLSYQSYNSKVQFFADLTVYLTTFGTNYQPVNEALSVTGLNTLYTDAVGANNEVKNTFTQFSQNNATRIASYYELSQTAIGIKESIKAQYGFDSNEYQLVKGLII